MKVTDITFSNEQLETLLDAQNELNEKYAGEEWRDLNPASGYLVPMFTEIAEFFESAPRMGDMFPDLETGEMEKHGWKHWKPYLENDEQNMSVETIDVLHFFLSVVLQATSKENILASNKSVLGAFEDEELNPKLIEVFERTKDYPAEMIISSYAKFISQYQQGDLGDMMLSFYILFSCMYNSCNRSIQDMFDGYFKKNELNSKRIDGGYTTDGSYQKIDEDGNEDNKQLEV